MSIYTPHTALDRTPYTYLIGWSKFDIWYYGVRFSKNCHPSDLFKTYFTSSKHVHTFCLSFGFPDVILVKNTFDNKHKALLHENKILRRLNAHIHPKMLNASNGYGKYFGDVSGKKQSKEHITKRTSKRVGTTHPVGTADKISKAHVNRVTVTDTDGNIFKVTKDDPRWISGELKSPNIGIFTAVDSNGIKHRISKDHPKFISGELVAESKGRKYELPTVPTLREFITSISPKSKGNSWFMSLELKLNIRTTEEIFTKYLSPRGFVRGRKIKFD